MSEQEGKAVLRKKLDTEESRAFWRHVEATAKVVRSWPAWMRGEVEPPVPPQHPGASAAGGPTAEEGE
jgi:hypothetical protein